MRRRRFLALGAGAVGLAGCGGYVGNVEEEVADGAPIDVDRTETAPPRSQGPDTTPSVGASLNGQPHRIRDDLALIGESDTRWLHAFLDVRAKREEGVVPREDPDVRTLRRAGRETDVEFIVSLMWDFKGNFGEKGAASLPDTGSDREAELFEYATELLEAIDTPVEVVVLGNEPTWETPKEDVTSENPQVVPFTRDLKNHLLEQYTGDPRFLLGSFNKLYEEYVREEQFPHFHRQFFEMARTDDDIDGIDLHVHYDGIEEAEEMLAVGRRAVPEGMIVCTEFSPVWRYDRNKDEPIGGSEAGKRFADRYDLPEGMTAVEYLEAAKDDPLPPAELADFYDAMPWYNEQFIVEMYDLLETYSVSVSTISLLQGTGMRHIDWTEDWTPFHINFLFQRALLDSEYGAHPNYIDDYRDRT